MISKEEALKIYEAGRYMRRKEAIDIIKEDKLLTEVFDYLEENIEREAYEGSRSFEIHEQTFLKRFPGLQSSDSNDNWYVLIVELGFKVVNSFSSNRENERIWIRWEDEPEFNK